MSKINQIQNELREQSGEKFQKIADAYLHKKGYKQINPLGYEQFRQQRIQDFFVNYNLEDYKQFFEQCLEIQEETDRRNHNTYHLPSQVARILINLANRDPQLYADVVKNYISLGNPLNINDSRLINHLIQILDIDKTYEIVNQNSYSLKRKWLFDFYRLLPQEIIRGEHLEQLYSL